MIKRMTDCIFCMIAKGTIPSQKVYEDEQVLAFSDLNPQAPVHILVIPKEHMATAAECADRGDHLIGAVFSAATRIARDQGLEDGGYRLVVNTGAHAGQTVHHFHVHILGGQKLSEGMA